MNIIVLDTDVISFIAKGDSRASLYSPMLIGAQACVCFQTIAELQLWMLVRRWNAARQQAMEAFLTRFVVLPYDAQMAHHWASLSSHRRKSGNRIECGDAWIAATALRHDATLLTHNSSHYADIPGLKMVSHAPSSSLSF